MAPHRERGVVTLFRLFAYARPYLLLVGLTIVFSLLYAGGLTGRAYLTRPLIDDIAAPNIGLKSLEDVARSGQAADREELEQQRRELEQRIDERLGDLLLAAVLIVLGMPLARLIRDYTGEFVMTRITVDIQRHLCERMLSLPLSRFEREGRSDLVSRMVSDTAVANRAQSLIFGEALQDVAIVVTAAGVAFWLNWRLALVVLLVGPPVAVILQVFGRRIRRSSQARQEQIAQVIGRLVQILDGIKVIKAFRAEGLELEAFSRENMRYFRRAMRVIRNRVFSRTLVEFASQAAFISLLLLGIYAIIGALWNLSLGVLTAFLFISAMLYRPTKNLTGAYNAVQDALPAARRLFEILDTPPETPDPLDAVDVEGIREGIRFRGVSFNYGREPVLSDLDLELPAGQVVAVVGRTGAGKTTIADLLLRFGDPTEGVIEIDGVDIRRIRRNSLREQVAIVTQEPFLFDTTILENIRYGRQDATVDEVIEAARAANAHEFIEHLPDGYETTAGEFGARLSGGQRQRITIARAILRDAQLLIFDEATSALDAASERLVHDAIWNLMKGRTVLLIAHRLSTVRAADRIVMLEDGRIADQGTHDELYSRSDLYRELVELQLSPATTR